jgi:phosphoenolpyruvate---glycerone phosphotransferase subunit DhaL
MMLHYGARQSIAPPESAVVDCELIELVELACQRIIAATDELTELDSAIGDGDHGINMKRGCEALLVEKSEINTKTLSQALHSIGEILLMKVGGASGPLYATFLLSLSKQHGSSKSFSFFSDDLTVAVDAVKRRGKSDMGQKTLLDVLVPIAQHISSGGASPASVKILAARAAAATIPMRATCGRASFVGERSVGHMDPGARSCQIMIEAICDVLEGHL